MKTTIVTMACAAAMCSPLAIQAQTVAADSVMQHAKGNRLSVGGYGEAAFSRNFYSDSGNRYSSASSRKNDPSHGRFDIPHAVIYLGYNFGKGWTLGTEIEFEHGGTGSAIEYEAEEAIEFEQEQERGGEVELEQFWIQKSFGRFLNIRAGHIVVPFGLTNAYHEPLNFFTVYRPEGEKPFEFETANKYGFSARIDNYTIPGLRLGVSGYYGQSMHNAVPHDMETGKNKNIKGNIYLGAFDFTYNAHNWVARGNADYGYVSDAKTISAIRKPGTQYVKPYESNQVFGSHAIATSIEVGYDIFSQIAKLRADRQKLYVFGHFEYYNSCIGSSKEYTSKKIFAGGLNYYPLPQVCVKAEYSYRKFKSQYNDEPALNIGVAYQGQFL